jgi:cytochrome P450
MASSESHTTPVPSHVPPGLVRAYPYVMGARTTAHPHDFIADIHKGPRIFWAERGGIGQGGWVPRRLADMQRIFFDAEHFSNRDLAPFAKMVGETWSSIPADTDPPHHALYRRMVSPLFTPVRMAAMEDKIRGYAREQIMRLRSRGECEYMSEFAFEFPIKVFLELMDMPQDRIAQFLDWEAGLLHSSDLKSVAAATRSVVDYLRGEIDDRRRNPRQDLISYGVQVTIENGRSLTDDELLGFCFNLFIGGLDTVSTHMGLQIRHVAEHPEHQALLRAEPKLIPDAVDELMRAYAAVSMIRTCVKEIETCGVTIRPGDKVLLPTYLAGRDPEAFERPEEVILNRRPRHISFGYGPHVCVGIHLARRELRIALQEFLAHIPEFRIEPGIEIESYLGAIIQPIRVPLVWAVGKS